MSEQVTEYRFLQCPSFIRKDGQGRIVSMQCKICGNVIADTQEVILRHERTPAGQIVKVVQRQFVRLGNYREIKIGFENPRYFHITHGCSDCLKMNMPIEVLAELHAADQAESPDGYTRRERAQVPTGVLILCEDQSGIV